MKIIYTTRTYMNTTYITMVLYYIIFSVVQKKKKSHNKKDTLRDDTRFSLNILYIYIYGDIILIRGIVLPS